MTEFSGMLAAVRRIATNPGDDQAAVRHILWRVDNGQLSREAALEVLQTLGLIHTPPKTSPEMAAELPGDAEPCGAPENLAAAQPDGKAGHE